MRDRSFASVVSSLASAAIFVLLVPLTVQAEDAPSRPTPPFGPEELEAVLAPIALYPDALLAQIFMGSTYPLEIVEAARWSKEHPDVKGDAVADAVEDQPWDPSVKSLVAFPQVLTMMNEKLDWTQKLGDAFLAQQADVMQAVQRLRNQAMETGNLKSTDEVTVKTEPAPPPPAETTAAAAPPPAQTIIIESADPEVVYVPTYNPTVVYGGWAYPSYPPYYYYPPGYVAGTAFWSFTAGVVVGGALWGNCNWGGNDIDIDVNNNFNRNTNIDRSNTNIGSNNKWSHNSEHRKGVGYRDSATQQKYGRGNSQGTQAREQYRGHAEQGRQQIAREGVGNQRDVAGNPIGSRDSSRASQGASNRAGTSNRATTSQAGNRTASRDAGASSRASGASSRSSGASNRSSSGSRSSAFGGGSASHTRASSSRGMSSRSSAGMRGGGGRGGGRRR